MGNRVFSRDSVGMRNSIYRIPSHCYPRWGRHKIVVRQSNNLRAIIGPNKYVRQAPYHEMHQRDCDKGLDWYSGKDFYLERIRRCYAVERWAIKYFLGFYYRLSMLHVSAMVVHARLCYGHRVNMTYYLFRVIQDSQLVYSLFFFVHLQKLYVFYCTCILLSCFDR